MPDAVGVVHGKARLHGLHSSILPPLAGHAGGVLRRRERLVSSGSPAPGQPLAGEAVLAPELPLSMQVAQPGRVTRDSNTTVQGWLRWRTACKPWAVSGPPRPLHPALPEKRAGEEAGLAAQPAGRRLLRPAGRNRDPEQQLPLWGKARQAVREHRVQRQRAGPGAGVVGVKARGPGALKPCVAGGWTWGRGAVDACVRFWCVCRGVGDWGWAAAQAGLDCLCGCGWWRPRLNLEGACARRQGGLQKAGSNQGAFERPLRPGLQPGESEGLTQGPVLWPGRPTGVAGRVHGCKADREAALLARRRQAARPQPDRKLDLLSLCNYLRVPAGWRGDWEERGASKLGSSNSSTHPGNLKPELDYRRREGQLSLPVKAGAMSRPARMGAARRRLTKRSLRPQTPPPRIAASQASQGGLRSHSR